MRSVNKQSAAPFSAGAADATWRTSSRCSHGDCVQVGSLPARSVGVRDTKNQGGGPELVFTPAAWRSFVTGVRLSGTTR
jgi:Domain of unknown function (DUF397)